jgi:uncharacterized protein YqeY
MTFEQLKQELVISMKEKNKIRKQVVADIMNITKNIAIEKKSRENITEEMVDTAALKVMKTAKEQIDTCPITRTELLQEYKEYFAYAVELAPKMMSEEEIKKVANEVIQSAGNPKPIKGWVMKQLMPKVKGKADGKLVNKVVEELLK